jgi:hypothetical protein
MMGMGVCAVAVMKRARVRGKVFMGEAPIEIFAGLPVPQVSVRVEHTAPEFRVEKG